MANDKVIPCLIHIPCKMPDGDDVDPEMMNSFFELLDRQFGGSTPLGILDGRWTGPDGKTIVEPMHRVEVSVKKSQVSNFERVARLIGQATQQKVMYVVINFQAETRFLFVDDEDEDNSQQKPSVG